MRCPFCGSPMESKPEYNLNPQQKEMFETIVKAGPAGIATQKFKDKFFRSGVSPITVRTTLFRLNKGIKPLRIVTRFGTLRLSE